MRIQNSEIAEKFNRLANLLEIEGANPFRVRAYRDAARTVLGSSENISDLIQEENDLTELPGIGKDLDSKIKEIVNTGHLTLLEEVEKKTPGELCEFLKIPSLGPKRVGLLYKKYKIKTLERLREIAESKKILKLRGFGEKTRAGILEELKKIKSEGQSRLLLNQAQDAADIVVTHLKKIPIQQITVAGSFRRKKETVGDLDILVTSKRRLDVIDHFLKLDSIAKVISHGTTRSTILLRSGVQVDLRVVPDSSYGAALLYFTGSKAHNIALRKIALKRGMKINEYGLFKGTKKLASKREKDLYQALKLPYIEPELRENAGEIEAAFKGTLPKLIRSEDIEGDLHVHTHETDGVDSIRDMALAAQRLGYSYLGITDHSQRMAMTHGFDSKRLLRQIRTLDRLNTELNGITLLKGIEVDILENGDLDLPNEVLEQLDFTVCSIHSYFRLSKEKQTARIIRALQNPHCKILGHPTGRLIGTRPPIDLNWDLILPVAKKLNRVFEVNAQPERMDLSDIFCRRVKDAGIKLVVSTDAHSVAQLNYMKFGVGQARRGWLEKSDVINTLSLTAIKKLFNQISS